MKAVENVSRSQAVTVGATNDAARALSGASEHPPPNDVDSFTRDAFDALFGANETADEDAKRAAPRGQTGPSSEPLAGNGRVAAAGKLDDSEIEHRQIKPGQGEIKPNLPPLPTPPKAGRKPRALIETGTAGASVESQAPAQVKAQRSAKAEARTGSWSEVRERVPRAGAKAKTPQGPAPSEGHSSVPLKKTNRSRTPAQRGDNPTSSAGFDAAQPAPPGGSGRQALELRALLNDRDRDLLDLRNELLETRRELLVLKDTILAAEREKIALTDAVTAAEAEVRRVCRERDTAMADVQQACRRAEEHRRGVEMLTTTVAALRRDHEQVTLAHNARIRELTAEHEQALRSALAEADSQFVRQQAETEAAIALAATQAQEKITAVQQQHERALAQAKQHADQLQRELEQALASLSTSEARHAATQQSIDYAKDALAAARAALDGC